jgi:uncharacterized protein YnzC (UPF0291/DUF896 family)
MNRERIQKINELIKKIKDKEILKEIFYIVQEELESSGEYRYSHNNNGIFFDLTILTHSTLERIEELAKNNIIQTDSDKLT